MGNILLVASGVGGILIALLHGYLGHVKVLRPIGIGGTMLLRINSAVFQLSTIYWLAGGVLLIMTPIFADAEKSVIVALVGGAYLTGAAGNFWASRGTHFGWMALLAVTCLAFAGLATS